MFKFPWRKKGGEEAKSKKEAQIPPVLEGPGPQFLEVLRLIEEAGKMPSFPEPPEEDDKEDYKEESFEESLNRKGLETIEIIVERELVDGFKRSVDIGRSAVAELLAFNAMGVDEDFYPRVSANTLSDFEIFFNHVSKDLRQYPEDGLELTTVKLVVRKEVLKLLRNKGCDIRDLGQFLTSSLGDDVQDLISDAKFFSEEISPEVLFQRLLDEMDVRILDYRELIESKAPEGYSSSDIEKHIENYKRSLLRSALKWVGHNKGRVPTEMKEFSLFREKTNKIED